MISVKEAQDLIIKHTLVRPKCTVDIKDLSEEVLHEPLIADRCYPPFNRVAMDGIAISTAAWDNGQRAFPVSGCQKAGEKQKTLTDPEACIEVMTGAPLPTGTNCVIRYEDTQIKNQVATVIPDIKVSDMKNVHLKGLDYNEGDELVPKGTLMFSPEWSITASVGKARLKIAQRPKIAVVSTGDELVDVDKKPLDFQIRRSNSYALLSSLKSHGFNTVTLEHLDDNKEDILTGLQSVLEQNDVVILSGGVSMGKFDFIPQCLADLKVNQIFHKVRQKPGKPLWFGVTEDNKSVFGLPGNPVSAITCLHRYVLPALWHSLGLEITKNEPKAHAVLTEDIIFKKNLSYFLPVKTEISTAGVVQATPVRSNGSGDFSSLIKSTGFLELPEADTVFKKGTAHPLYLWKASL